MSVTKAEIIARIEEKVGFSKEQAIDVVEATFEIIKGFLEKGENVKIPGFGSFVVRSKNPRRGRNPETGEKIIIKGRRMVTVSAPDGWKISSGLDAVPNEPQALIAPSYDVLIDAPIEIGTHEVLTFEIDDVPHEIAIWGQGNYDRDKLVEDVKTISAEQIEMWGDMPYSRYVFLLHVTSGAGGGTEHLNSTIMQTSRDSFHPDSRFKRFLGLADASASSDSVACSTIPLCRLSVRIAFWMDTGFPI